MDDELIHYHEYALGGAARLLDTAWTVMCPAVLGSMTGNFLVLFMVARMGREGSVAPDLGDVPGLSFEGSLVVGFGLWLAACIVNVVRCLHYRRRLAQFRGDVQAQRRPPPPWQSAVARAAPSEGKPFSGLWTLGLLVVVLGGILAIIAIVGLGSEGAVSALVGGTVAVAIGSGLIWTVSLIRRRMAATPFGWRHNPTDPGNAEQKVRRIELPRRYLVAVWADRINRVLVVAAATVFTLVCELSVGAAGDPAMLAAALADESRDVTRFITALLVSSAAMIVLIAAAAVFELMQHSVLLRVLEREAAHDTAMGRTATRPDPRLTAVVLSGHGPGRRAAQLLAGLGALVLVLTRPTFAYLDKLDDAGWSGEQVALTLMVGASAAIVLAVLIELCTANGDRDRRNHLFRTWPRALSAARDGGAMGPSQLGSRDAT